MKGLAGSLRYLSGAGTLLGVCSSGGWVTEPAEQFIAWYLTAEQPQIAPHGAEAPAGSQGDLLHLVRTWRSNKLWSFGCSGLLDGLGRVSDRC
jgi:hypothetical protein